MSNLKNYTSKVPVSKTLSDIEDELVSIGAKRIIKEYNDQHKVESIVFAYQHNGSLVNFLLPAKVDSTYQHLIDKKKKVTPSQSKTIYAQAERTAWKNIYDWVRAQVVLIKLNQVEFMQVFLNFAYDYQTNKTFYDTLKEGGLKSLPKNNI